MQTALLARGGFRGSKPAGLPALVERLDRLAPCGALPSLRRSLWRKNMAPAFHICEPFRKRLGRHRIRFQPIPTG
jgi:hypothetical protein